MTKRYFDKTGKEIKPGMTVYFGSSVSGSCVPVVLHEGRLCFYTNDYVPLDDVDPSNGIIEYDPEVDS